MARRKPLPTRRGRIRPGAAGEAAPAAEGEAPAEVAAAEEPAEESDSGAAAPASRGGLEMALIVVTLVALIAAFALIQLQMHSAFGQGWPV